MLSGNVRNVNIDAMLQVLMVYGIQIQLDFFVNRDLANLLFKARYLIRLTQSMLAYSYLPLPCSFH